MIEQGVLSMVDLLRRENLVKRLDVDLDAAAYLDGWVYHQRFGGFLLAQPLGVVAHVSAGNVFVGGVDSLIQGIVTKNVSLMKMSSVDPLFPVLFARSLRELDAEGVVSASVALLLWPGGDAAIERVIKQGCDGVVVYGGAETVRSYREDLGLHTKLIEYGPEYSFVMVMPDALARTGLDAAARRIARDVVMWEQSACSSPHAVYVENAEGATTADDLADALARALAEWARELPPGTITDDEGTEITRVREMAKVEQVMGTACLLAPPGGGTEWTVVVQRTPDFDTSCLNRTVFVKPVARLEEGIAAMEPLAEYLQSVAILADLPRAEALGQALTRLGADRFVEIGQMAVRKHGTPHDGTRGLAELVRWTSLAMVPGERAARQRQRGRRARAGAWRSVRPALAPLRPRRRHLRFPLGRRTRRRVGRAPAGDRRLRGGAFAVLRGALRRTTDRQSVRPAAAADPQRRRAEEARAPARRRAVDRPLTARIRLRQRRDHRGAEMRVPHPRGAALQRGAAGQRPPPRRLRS